MVPYVRKSFYKHYKDGLKYIDSAMANKQINISLTDSANYSITDQDIYNHKASYQYAMDMTVKELNQAVEAMFHNLNTLQSRSGN